MHSAARRLVFQATRRLVFQTTRNINAYVKHTQNNFLWKPHVFSTPYTPRVPARSFSIYNFNKKKSPFDKIKNAIISASLKKNTYNFSGFTRNLPSLFNDISRRYVRFPGNNRFSIDNIVHVIIGANLVTFFLWRIAGQSFMQQNFLISLYNFWEGRIHTLITSAFSHITFDHLLFNMFGFYFFGSEIQNMFGGSFLLKLYISGAVAGSIAFLANNAFIQPWLQGLPRKYYDYKYALGASGAVTSIILFQILLYPKAVYYLYFIVPVPGLVLGAIIVGSDMMRFVQGDGDVSAASHLGGALVAVLAWAKFKKRLF